MKKFIISAFLTVLMCGFTSCSDEPKSTDESNDINTEKLQSKDINDQITNFKKALKWINLPENQPTAEERLVLGSELSDGNKERLYAPAKELIYASGMDDATFLALTNHERDKVINLGFKVYVSLINNN
ncbi:hypothetical protein [Flavobacterium sp. NKUCC04_CG]|uniref:hypothetical protein n=1 Tax=Flavobacterium sp. NKUCC04_CG TaxID=2842121 RepID=UPI001C5BB9F9|nr:hypothetical protein [Flavobacterium sp. NKUCC04_CG]MBW3517550.1 hypothetical protein [Flavobacterium sp. NKUCC04_CG]